MVLLEVKEVRLGGGDRVVMGQWVGDSMLRLIIGEWVVGITVLWAVTKGGLCPLLCCGR